MPSNSSDRYVAVYCQHIQRELRRHKSHIDKHDMADWFTRVENGELELHQVYDDADFRHLLDKDITFPAEDVLGSMAIEVQKELEEQRERYRFYAILILYMAFVKILITYGEINFYISS